MWAVASSTSICDVPTPGHRCRPVGLIVACVVIFLAASFVQGDLTMPREFEHCNWNRGQGTCPPYYYCTRHNSWCEPCSSCSRPNYCEGSISQCEKWQILTRSDTTYTASPRHDLSPSCDATELRENRLLSATCSRLCLNYSSSLLCFIETECNASCTVPGIGRGGVWPWTSSCSCHLGDDNKLVCNWTKPLPACTNATVNIPDETKEDTRLTPRQPFPDVDTEMNATLIIPHEASVNTLLMPPLQQPTSNVDTVTLAEDSTKRTSTVMTPTEIVAFVCAIIATSSAAAAIVVGIRLRRRVTTHGRQNAAAGEGPVTDGPATVINNSVRHVNLQVAEIGHLSVGNSGGSAVSPPEVQVQGQHSRPTMSCGRRDRHGPCPCRCDVASPAESRPFTVRAATASNSARCSLRCGKCRHLCFPGVQSPSFHCDVGNHSCIAYGDCHGEPRDDGDDCDESGGCSSPLLQSLLGEPAKTPAADLLYCCGRPGDGTDTLRHECTDGGGHCGDGSLYVETDAVPDHIPPPSGGNEIRPGRGGCDYNSPMKSGVDAAVDCNCCISGRCAPCGSDDGSGSRHDGHWCHGDLAEGEWPHSPESTSSSDRCSAEEANNCDVNSEAFGGLLWSSAIVDPEPNVRTAPSHRSVERTVIKAECVGVLEIIPTADDTRAGNIAADLDLGNVGLLRVGCCTVVAAAGRH